MFLISISLFLSVVRGTNGESRGYAFVNFTSEADYKDALTSMQGHRGLGSNPLRVSLAIPRNYNMIPGTTSSNSSTTSSLTTAIASTIVQAVAAQSGQAQTAATAAGRLTISILLFFILDRTRKVPFAA